MLEFHWANVCHVWLQGKLVGRVFEWLLPQPVDDCLRVLSSCLLGGKNVTPLMCSTTETIGSSNADDGEDTVSHSHINLSGAIICSSAALNTGNIGWVTILSE